MNMPELKITNDRGVEIKGLGAQIMGMDKDEYQISIFGIPYPFYEEEFPQHIKEYADMFEEE